MRGLLVELCEFADRDAGDDPRGSLGLVLGQL